MPPWDAFRLVFGLFRDKGLEDFAREMARELSSRVPLDTLDAKRAGNPKFKATLARALQQLFAKVRGYCRDHNVGLLKKARLTKVFQDELAGLGYPKDFVREVTLVLAEQMTQAG